MLTVRIAKAVFKSSATRIRAGTTVPCPKCQELIVFDDGSKHEVVRKALSAARKVRQQATQQLLGYLGAPDRPRIGGQLAKAEPAPTLVWWRPAYKKGPARPSPFFLPHFISS